MSEPVVKPRAISGQTRATNLLPRERFDGTDSKPEKMARMSAVNGELRLGDCIAGMRALEPASIDAVVTDPPYGYGIGGKRWDSFRTLDAFEAFTAEWASGVHRALKPDGVIAVFAAPRIAHRTAVGLERAHFVILDQIVWLFGNGLGINVKHGRLKPGHEVIILAAK